MKPFNLKEYLANPAKKLITRDGRKVKRVLCTDVKNMYSIAVVTEVHEDNNAEQIIVLTKDGEYLPVLHIRMTSSLPLKNTKAGLIYTDPKQVVNVSRVVPMILKKMQEFWVGM